MLTHSLTRFSDIVGGKLVRKRTNNVLYDDHLTEAQFQKMIEKQAEDAEREVQQQKIMRKYGEQVPDANALSEGTRTHSLTLTYSLTHSLTHSLMKISVNRASPA